MNSNIDPHRYSGPLEDIEKKKPTGKNFKIKIIIGILVFTLGVGIMVYMIFGDKPGFDGIGSDTSFIPFIAIWPALIIPIIASQKKKKLNQAGQKMNADQKRVIVFLAAGGALFVILGVGVMLYVASA
ncbi:hypothetical protein ACFL3C_01110 [Patescibacteria group bacterium]